MSLKPVVGKSLFILSMGTASESSFASIKKKKLRKYLVCVFLLSEVFYK